MTAREDLIRQLATDSSAASFAGDMYGVYVSDSDVRDATDMVDAAINEALHAAADRIRAHYGKPRWPDDEPEYAYGYNHATHDAADLIDPQTQEQP